MSQYIIMEALFMEFVWEGIWGGGAKQNVNDTHTIFSFRGSAPLVPCLQPWKRYPATFVETFKSQAN